MSVEAPAPPETKEGEEPLAGAPAGNGGPQSVPDPDPAQEPGAEEPAAGFPGEGEPEEDPPAIPELVIEGARQLSMKVGGSKPDESLVKMRGGSIAVGNGGEFEKGSLVDLTVRCRVQEVHFVDKVDKQTGEIVGTVRRHILKPERVEKV